MAHFKCTTCVARVWREGDAADHELDLCPGCGGPLVPVGRAADVIGLRALRTRPHTGRSIADEVRARIARNDAARVERLAAQRRDERPHE
jgi:NAD-dependent SIR2 family protein deacetylase